MKHKTNISNTLKTSSYHNKGLSYWLKYPFVLISLFFVGIYKEVRKWITYNKAWLSIEEMPIWNWIQVIETGKITFIYKDGGDENEYAHEQWLELQQQYMDEFGLDPKFAKRLKLEKKLALLNIEFVLTRRQHLLNIIKMTEIDIEDTKQRETMDFYQVLDYVEKYKGFSIDPKKVSVKNWYYSLKNMSNG